MGLKFQPSAAQVVKPYVEEPVEVVSAMPSGTAWASAAAVIIALIIILVILRRRKSKSTYRNR